MDNNNLIQELTDEQIEKLLDYAPSFNEQNSENISKLFMEKVQVLEESPNRTRSAKKALFASLAAVMLILCSGIVLAATLGVNLGDLYNSFFNVKNASHRIDIGDTVVNNGIEITLVAAFTDGDRAHIMLELRDLEGQRISGSMSVLWEEGSYYGFLGAPAVYDETENKVTMALTMLFNNQIELGDNVELSIETLLSGIDFIENEKLDFDMTIGSDLKSGISRDEWDKIADEGKENVVGVEVANNVDTEKIDNLLNPDDMNVQIEGIDWAVISNIGIIDERLHIQTKRTEKYNSDYNCGRFTLIDSNENVIRPIHEVNKGNYSELIFDIGSVDLKEARLAISGPRIDNVIAGPWRLSFNITAEAEKISITAKPTDQTYFSQLEIECSPLATSIRIYMAEYNGKPEDFLKAAVDYMGSFDEPYLTLKDGSRITLNPQSGVFDYTMGTGDYSSQYFDIGQLSSITYCAEEYFFH